MKSNELIKTVTAGYLSNTLVDYFGTPPMFMQNNLC
jgi:hypothetical protein